MVFGQLLWFCEMEKNWPKSLSVDICTNGWSGFFQRRDYFDPAVGIGDDGRGIKNQIKPKKLVRSVARLSSLLVNGSGVLDITNDGDQNQFGA